MAYTRMIGKTVPPTPPRTMTVLLDLTDSDPTHWATYADDAAGMEAGSDDWDEFFGHYPCILDNGVELGKLNRNDFSKYEDNTSAPITTIGKDAMICFPKRGIKIEYLDANTLSVSMTEEEDKTGYGYKAHSYKGNPLDAFYLGVYKGYVSSSKLYSVSGQTPTTSVTIGNFRTYAQSRGTGYEQSAYYQLVFRQVMYLLKYKGQNAQIAVGKGFTDRSNTAIYGNTGYTNNKGMDWGENTGTLPMKLFGLEDFYGNILEFIDGIHSGYQYQLLATDGPYNNTGSGYTTISSATASSNWAGYMRYPVGTNEGAFCPLISNTNKGNSSTFFCDHTAVNYDKVAAFGGEWRDTDVTGVFRFHMNASSSYNNESFGSRLMYMKQSS